MALSDLFFWRKKQSPQERIDHAVNTRVAELLEMQHDAPDEWQLLIERQLNGKTKSDLQESSFDGGTVMINTKAEGSGWEIMGSAWKGHIAADQQIMIAQARRFFRFDPNAQAAVMGLVEYLLGRGVNITPKSQDPRIWKLWRNFWTDPSNKMGIRQFEIVKRLFRDGEIFLRYFTADANKLKTPFTTIRFMDPIDVRRGAKEAGDLTDKTSQGIIFDPEDAETPLFYFMRGRINQYEESKIDATEVQHIKFPVADMDQARGESALQSVMDLFTHYKQWLKNRIILNKLRTAIFAVREIDMQSGANVSSLAQSLPTSGRGASGETKKMNIRSGSIYTPPPGVKMRMESANINASDVKEDGRNMILQMAAGTGLPEYMFGDASNANYSSTMMAESPFVKRIHFFQAYLEETLWKPMFRRVVENAVKAGKLTAPAEEDIFANTSGTDLTEGEKKPAKPFKKKSTGMVKPDANGNQPDPDKDNADEATEGESPDMESELEIFYGCDVEWPEVIHRDPKEQTEALVLARNEGWVSDKTCSEKLGFDYAEEVRKQKQIAEDAEESGNALMNHNPGDAQADIEARDAQTQITRNEAAAGAGGGGTGE